MAKNNKPEKASEKLPDSHLAALDVAGFTVVRYLNTAIRVMADSGPRSEWLPGLCVAPGDRPDSYRVIEWLPKGHPANGYSFDGWQTYSGHACGGMCDSILHALSWFTWVEEQKTKMQ